VFLLLVLLAIWRKGSEFRGDKRKGAGITGQDNIVKGDRLFVPHIE
jgi:hypothetical protein